MKKPIVTLFVIATIPLLLFCSCTKEKKDNDGIENPNYGKITGYNENDNSDKGEIRGTGH